MKNFFHECKVNYHISLVVLNVHVPKFLRKVFSEKRGLNLFISEVFINYNRHEPIANLCKHYHVKVQLRIPHWHSSTIFAHSSEIFLWEFSTIRILQAMLLTLCYQRFINIHANNDKTTQTQMAFVLSRFMKLNYATVSFAIAFVSILSRIWGWIFQKI